MMWGYTGYFNGVIVQREKLLFKSFQYDVGMYWLFNEVIVQREKLLFKSFQYDVGIYWLFQWGHSF